MSAITPHAATAVAAGFDPLAIATTIATTAEAARIIWA